MEFFHHRCFHNNFTWNLVAESCELDPDVALVLFAIDMIHYWPFNNNALDYAGQANMTEGIASGSLSSSHTFFDRDRFGRLNSALNLNNWFKQVSNDVYFQGDFSVSFWIKFQANNQSGTSIGFLDFSSNVVFGCTKDNCFLEVDIDSSTYVKATTQLKTGFWTFFVATLQGLTGSIYLDGNLVGQNVLSVPTFIVGLNNLIGARQNNVTDIYGTSLSIIDELRIFNRSLTNTEIISLMNLDV